MKILDIENLSKFFGSYLALDNVSLSVEKGTVLGLLGPNGAGKTTLLRIINGILVKDSGSVKVFDNDASLATARKIGYMPEERGLYDNMSVENQIIYFGELKGARSEDIRPLMNEYLSLFNLKGSNKRKIKELSKGNQQKVQIIATLIHRPELVILDEPFSGFDPINGALLESLIDRLKIDGTTLIISSHNMHAVEEMCDSIALVNKGRLILQGELEDVKDRYKKNEYIAVVSDRLQLDKLGEAGLIRTIEQILPPKGRKGFSYRFKKNPDISNSQILNAISDQAEILLFEESLPTLNDIFISLVSGESM